MMPHLLEELFALAGRSVHDYVSLKPLDPLYSLHFGDTVFTPSTDQEQTAGEIERLFPGNGVATAGLWPMKPTSWSESFRCCSVRFNPWVTI